MATIVFGFFVEPEAQVPTLGCNKTTALESAASVSATEKVAVEQFAVLVIDRFAKELSVNPLLGSYFVPNYHDVSRQSALLQEFLAPAVLRRIDSHYARRTFVEVMNLYYLREICSSDANCMVDPNGIMPSEVSLAIDKSRFSRIIRSISEGGSEQELTRINTMNQLRAFLRDLERINSIFRTYFVTKEVHLTVPSKISVEARCGSAAYDIPETTKVFVISADMFTFFAVHSKASFRIVGIGFD